MCDDTERLLEAEIIKNENLEAYISRLEAAYLIADAGQIYWRNASKTGQPLPDLLDDAERIARESLERIKRGDVND